MRRLCLVVIAMLALCSAVAGEERSGSITTSDGVKLHYLEAGQGPAILFIPGWTMPADIWRKQIDYFAGHYRVIAVDPRSQGDSEKASDGNYPERRSRDYKELVDALHLAPVVLVGWSLGADEVMSYVQQFGAGGLRALVLVDEILGTDPTLADYKGTVQLAAVLQTQRHAFTNRFVRGMFKKPQPDAYYEHIFSEALKTPTDTTVTLLFNMFQDDHRPLLAKVKLPVYYPVTAHHRAAVEGLHLPANVKVDVYEDAGHALFVDDSDRFNRSLEDFIQGIPGK